MNTKNISSALRTASALVILGGFFPLACVATSTESGDDESQAKSDEKAVFEANEGGGGGDDVLSCPADIYVGACVGDARVWCDGLGNLQSEDCGAGGTRCGWDQEWDQYACTGEPLDFSCSAPIGCALPESNEPLGSAVVSGDEGSDTISYDGYGSKSFYFRVKETGWSDRSIRARVLLSIEDGADYDMWTQRITNDGFFCDGWHVDSSDAVGPGPVEETRIEDGDIPFVPDFVDVAVWIVPTGKGGCSKWRLEVFGNQ